MTQIKNWHGTSLLEKLSIPGLFITGTDTGVGKTVIAAAIARWFRDRPHGTSLPAGGGSPGMRAGAGASTPGYHGSRVAVCKIAATGCERRREGLVSEDAEYLAHWADARFPLDVICPQCWAEPLAPAVAAERSGEPLDWSLLQSSLSTMASASDCMVVEGVGGILVPMDARHTVLDVAKWLGLPTVIIARAALGTINHTLLTVHALRSAGVKVAGVVINRYPAESPGTAEETSPRAIEKWGKVPLLCVVPDEPFTAPAMPEGVYSAVSQVDWNRLAIR